MSDFKPLIFVMRCREIKESIESISNLPFSKVWVEYYNEMGIAKEAWPIVYKEAVEKGYTHMGMISDDITFSPEGAIAVFEAAKKFLVTAAWCNLDSGPSSNISKSPLERATPKGKGNWNLMSALYTIKEIENHKEKYIRTWFSGMSLHTMSIKFWGEYPFDCYHGSTGKGTASDFHICYRLQQNGIPIHVLRDCRMYHLRKEIGNMHEHEILVDKRDKNIRWEE